MAIGLQTCDAVLARAVSQALRGEAESRADDDDLAGIRAMFLDPRETCALEELASLWRVEVDAVRDVFHDELMVLDATDARIASADVLSATVRFSIVRPIDVERALRGEFSFMRPPSWRTVPVIVHVPQFIADVMTGGEDGAPCSLAGAIERLLSDHHCDARSTRKGSACE